MKNLQKLKTMKKFTLKKKKHENHPEKKHEITLENKKQNKNCEKL